MDLLTHTTASRMKRALLALLCLLAPLVRAESEYEVKAAYLINFAKLVQWPTASFAGEKSPLIIGIVGRSAISEELASLAPKATANGHPLEIRRVSANDSAALAACHVLFVAEAERAEPVFAAVQVRPVLVVGEAADFVRRGGALGFVKDEGTVKFEANQKAARRSGLTISAQLLKVARTVIER